MHNISCYAKKYKKLEKCNFCDYSEYCKDATYISQKYINNEEKVRNLLSSKSSKLEKLTKKSIMDKLGDANGSYIYKIMQVFIPLIKVNKVMFIGAEYNIIPGSNSIICEMFVKHKTIDVSKIHKICKKKDTHVRNIEIDPEKMKIRFHISNEMNRTHFVKIGYKGKYQEFK